jgi:flagellar hook-basal body complex protein FliE
MMLTGVGAPSLAQGLVTRGPTGPTGIPPVAPGAGTPALPEDFGSVLGQMAMEAVNVVKAGEATAVAGVRGQATTQQVVEAVMAAEHTLQASVAIRDKVVSAYLEVSRMSI